MSAIPDTHPLLLPNLIAKAQTSNETYLRGSVAMVDGYGQKGPKHRPFVQDQAVKKLKSWVYRAAMLNAMAMSSVPLKLYVRSRKKSEKLYRTRPVSPRQKRYLCGDSEHRPSDSVLRKVAEFGADFEEVTEPHPAITVLSQVNAWQNGFELTVLRSLYWQVTGNAYLHPVIDPALGVPGELYLLPSQWVKIVPNRARTGESIISGYVYGREPDRIDFMPDEVIQWRLPNLTDQYYGMGWVEAAWTALGLHESKRTMDTAKFDNFARPDWMLVVKSGASDSQLDRLEAGIESKLRGQRKSGRFLSVTGDVDAVPLNFDVPDIGDPDKIIEELAAVSGVPLHKLRGNDPVKANSETQDVGWLRDTILPYCRMDEEVLNAQYLPLFDISDDAVLAYDNPVPTNRAAEVEIITKQVGGPYRAVNEVRADEGLEPIAGGDALRTVKGDAKALGDEADEDEPQVAPTQQIQTTQDTVLAGGQVSAAVDIVAQVTAGTLPRDAGVAMLQTFFNLTPEVADRVMGSAGTKKPTVANPNPAQEARDEVAAEALQAKPAADDSGKAAEAVQVKAEIAPRPFPKADELVAVLRKVFADQMAAVLNDLSGIKSTGILPDKFIPLDTWDETLADAVKPVLEVMMLQESREMLTRLGASPDVFSVVNAKLPDAVQGLSLKFAKSTNETTSMALADALAALRVELEEGLTVGDTRIELRNRVKQVFDQASDVRAQVIAETEASRATHRADIMSAQESGLVKKKYWLLSGDACPVCQKIAADNADGIELDKTFAELGGEYGSIDGPPAHPRCQCSLTFTTASPG